MLETQKASGGVWIRRADLWRVGFHADALSAIYLMSGLVEVLEVTWHEKERVLMMVVKNTDRTNTLFRTGALQGEKISKYKSTSQPLMVSTTWRRRR